MGKYNVSLRKLLQHGISEPEFYGDLVYRIRKKMWANPSLRNNLENLLINRYKRIGYNPSIMRQTALLLAQSRLTAMLQSLMAQ